MIFRGIFRVFVIMNTVIEHLMRSKLLVLSIELSDRLARTHKMHGETMAK